MGRKGETMNQFYDEERAVQALSYLAYRAVGQTITKLVALKLIFLADRYHLRKYGRTILDDEYRAMKYGPVAMKTKRLMEHLAITGRDPAGTIAVEKLPGDRLAIHPLLTPDTRKLSETDIEALDCSLKQLFLHADIVDFTHQFPEWKKHKEALDRGAPSVRMDYRDFFLPCDVPGAEYCNAARNLVDMNRDFFEEDLLWSL